MITNFEQETRDLSTRELEIAEYIAPYFKNRTKNNPVRTSEIQAGVKKYKNVDLRPERVRAIIRFLRMSRKVIHLVGSSKGYYVARNKEEFEKAWKSLKERADAAVRLEKEMRFQLEELEFNNQ